MSNESFDIRIERVEIPCQGETLVGLLHLPLLDEATPRPALVFLGPLTSVKEQVPGHYAEAMAERGFITLSIDNRHFGESTGAPRQYEHPGKKVEDIRAAIDWLEAREDVDSARFGAVGICAGAGYMSGAVADDRRIGAFGAIAGFYHSVEKQKEWMGEGYARALARAARAREAFEETGEAEMIPAVGDGEVAMPLAEAFEYYGTERGDHENYTNAFALMSREHTLTWDALENAKKISQPTLMVHSDNALAPALARTFHENLADEDSSLVWMESEGQIDFYDDPDLIEPIADLLQEHFNSNL
jgi:fermentation-respiration switch protein FrsA (DUF1100 family)